MGIGIATIVRVFLFLAVLGVVVETATSAGFIHWIRTTRQRTHSSSARARSATASSVWCSCVRRSHQSWGCAYTSVSFLKTFHKSIEKHENAFIVGFIALSTVVMAFLGQPAVLLVLAGAVNGLILPITLGRMPHRIEEEIHHGRRLQASNMASDPRHHRGDRICISGNYNIWFKPGQTSVVMMCIL